MIFTVDRISFLCCVIWFSVCNADDLVTQIFVNRPINYVSDKFVSFSMSPADLVDIYQNERNSFSTRMREFGPSYLKITGNMWNLPEEKKAVFEKSELKGDLGEWLYDATKSHDIKLVVPLPYNEEKWDPRAAIKVLANLMKVDNVIWQLGSDFHATDAMKYIDDLSTMRTIIDTFAAMNKNQSWAVVGSDVTIGTNENVARLYSELAEHVVSAMGWTQSLESLYPKDNTEDVFAAQTTDPALREILNGRIPVWLTVSHSNRETRASDSECFMSCETNGLKWAQTLGDASRNGFKMVYAPIDQYEWFKPSLTYYTNLLHKRLMGEAVLATKTMNSNRFDTHIYSHCMRNVSGAFTIYGVNKANNEANVLAKMPPMRAGTEYMEYVLTVNHDNGHVQLNGNDIIEGAPLHPAIKVKKINKPAVLSMPARSIAFWVFNGAKLAKCERAHDSDQVDLPQMGKTSSEKLLQELIREQIVRDTETGGNGIEKMVRQQRSDIHNNIGKNHKLNAIKRGINANENGIHRRNRRSIGGNILAAQPRCAGNLRNSIYSEMDSMERRQLYLPFVSKMDGSKRSKRHINALSRLLEKFELKKPSFNFKAPSFKLGAAAIPPITAVHDIYSVNSAERKVFDSVENPELPTGDVHFDVEELANGAPNPAIAGYNGAQDYGRDTLNQEMSMMNDRSPTPVAGLNSQPHDSSDSYFESFFGDAPLAQAPPSPQSFNHPSPVVASSQQQPRMNELWEIEAAQYPSVPSQLTKQSTQIPDPSINTNIDFVVKELQPTWQKNQENLEKARNNLQKLYTPSVGGTKISSLLPNVARPQNIHSSFFDSAERRFFETRRRRRSIATDMNERIEERVQEMAGKHPHEDDESGEYNDLDDAIGKLSILDRALKIVASLDRTQNLKETIDFAKLSDDLKRLGEIVAQNTGNVASTSTPSPDMTNDNIQKRCKILSKSLEQRCVREPNKPLPILLKREQENKAKKPTGPLKKLLAKMKGIQRSKRSISGAFEDIRSNAIQMDDIQNEIFGESRPIEINFVKTLYHGTTTEKPIHRKLYDSAQEQMPKLLRVVKNTFTDILDTVTKQVSGWWQAWT